MKSPPTLVSRTVGTALPDTAMAGACPTTGGTVMRKTLLLASTSACFPSGESSTSSGEGGVGGVAPGGSGCAGGGGPATRTTTLRSVPSNRIDTSPSFPAHTYSRVLSGPTWGALRPSIDWPLPAHAMRVVSPPPAGSHTYSSSALLRLPKSSNCRIRLNRDPRTAKSRVPSRV
jgi:hypothetical protein